MEKQIKNDAALIAFCGLYCGSCGAYSKGKCPGCIGNEKATWCQIRTCNMQNGFKSCAECKEYSNVKDCKKYNNVIAKVIGFVSRTDRSACITMIKDKGYENFASFMSDRKWTSIKKS